MTALWIQIVWSRRAVLTPRKWVAWPVNGRYNYVRTYVINIVQSEPIATQLILIIESLYKGKCPIKLCMHPHAPSQGLASAHGAFIRKFMVMILLGMCSVYNVREHPSFCALFTIRTMFWLILNHPPTVPGGGRGRVTRVKTYVPMRVRKVLKWTLISEVHDRRIVPFSEPCPEECTLKVVPEGLHG